MQETERTVKKHAVKNINALLLSIFRGEVSGIQNQEVHNNLPRKHDVIRNIIKTQNGHRLQNTNLLKDSQIDRTLNGQVFFSI